MLRKILLITTLLLSIKVYAYDFEKDGIYYNIKGDEVEVTYRGSSYSSALYSGDIVIPESVEYNGKTYPVTSIGSQAFMNCQSLTSVTIPEGVGSIGGSAFSSCTSLTAITIPEGVTSIGISAFNYCPSLTSLTFNAKNCTYCGSPGYAAFPSSIATLTFGDKVTKIPAYFLYDGSYIETITIPNTVTSIGSYAFYKSTRLKSITIPEGVTSIGSSAFRGCSSLTAITIPEGVTSIGDYVFSECSSLTSVTIPEEVTSIRDYAFSGCSSLTSVTIPEGVTSIRDYTFSGCSSLTSVTIPEGLTSIGNYAFNKCSSLTSVTIPEGVTSIGNYAFSKCSSLTSLTFNAENCTSCGSSYSPTFPSSITTLTFGDKVTKIPDYFLYNGSNIETVTIPNSVASIGSYAFYKSTLLKSTTIPAGVTSIGSSAFSGCSSLTAITIPEGVTSIRSSTFSGCSSLTAIIIPEGVTSIGESAFKDCSSLTSLTFNAKNCTSCGSSSSPAFPSSITSLTFGDKVTKIPAFFLYEGSNIDAVTIPEGVTSIGESAFKDCSSLTSLTFNAKNCTSWGTSGNRPFPSSIASLTFGDKVTKIPAYFLYDGSNIETLTIPNSVTSIGYYAFYKSNKLKSLTLGSGLLSIGDYAFSYDKSSSYVYKIEIAKVFWLGNTPPEGSSNVTANVNYVANNQYNLSNKEVYQFLSSKFTVDGTVYVPVSPSDRTCDVVDCSYDSVITSVEISDKVSNKGIQMTVNNICQYAFYENEYIHNLTLSNKGYIGDYGFYGCKNLRTALVANKGSIGKYGFSGLTKLNNLTFGSSVTGILDYAFSGCSSIPELSIPNSVTQLGQYAFQNCSSVKSAQLGTGIPSLPNRVFYRCSSLNSITIPNDVKSIGDYVFAGCYSLADITIEDADEQKEQISSESNSSSSEIDKLTLGSNGSSPMFADCPLDEVNIGRKLYYKTASDYGYSPFYRNTFLRSVEITDAETQIYDNEFYGCSNLKSLKIGNGVKTIGNWAFSGCSSLDFFSAGYMVETIGEEAFSDCTGLKKYYSYSVNPPECGNQALDDINKWDCTLYVPKNSSDEYQSAAQWKEFFFIEEMDAIVAEKIILNSEEETLMVKDTYQLTAEILPLNVTNQNIIWSSNDKNVATVDENGLVTAVAEGETEILAYAADSSNTVASCKIVVLKGDSSVSNILSSDIYEIARYDINGNRVDESYRGLVIIRYSDGSSSKYYVR